MARFNTRDTRPRATSPVTTTGATTTNHRGGSGHLRDARSELFLLAVTNLVGQDTHYETAGTRDDRFTALVHTLAVEDPQWTLALLTWLRRDANLRSAALVGAAEFTRARLEAGLHGHSRAAVNGVLLRADEPGELLGYWTSRYGRRLPKPVKRGVADAVRRLYTERALLKYDVPGRAFRFADVLELTHPAPAPANSAWQGELFRHAIDRRHGRGEDVPAALRTVAARAALTSLPVAERRPLLTGPDGARRLAEAGMTWEAVAGWLQGPMDAAAWEAVVPSMGYMARLRNLRNFDRAGVSDDVAATVAAALADPAEVARSRQLPMRFYSAFNAAPSLRWGHALERALAASMSSVPALRGRTLIMVDTSGSMHSGFSRDGSLKRWDAAALFGIALGRACADADVVSFSSLGVQGFGPHERTRPFPLRSGGSVLGDLGRWKDGGWFLGRGTETAAALRDRYSGHDRVVVVTDEQAARGDVEVDRAVPQGVPMYTWNLAGYRTGHAPSGTAGRHTFGGLTDQAFGMIPLLEAGRDACWPWESQG